MIVIVDYGMGNAASIVRMFKRVGHHALVSHQAADIREARALVLPGVGAFDSGMESLKARGLVPLLTEAVRERKVPLLGICLGMQLLAERSEEGGSLGLGWVEAEVRRLPGSPQHRVPHMGWSTLKLVGESPLLAGLAEDARFYFVHSYYVACRHPEQEVAVAQHGMRFVAALAHDNIFGVQFHPEKSHRFGMQLLGNFARVAA